MTHGVEPVTRANCSPTADGTYHEVDATVYGVPAGAAGVLLEVINTGHATYTYGIHKKGSGDDIDGTLYANVVSPTKMPYYVGLDGDGKFEAKLENAAVQVWIYGYVPADAGTFLTDAVDKTPAGTGTQTIDISGDVGGDAARLAFFIVKNTHASNYLSYCLRSQGDAFASAPSLRNGGVCGAAVCCDEFQRMQVIFDDTALKFYLIGWLLEDYVGHVEPVAWDVEIGEENTWVEKTLSDIDDGAKFAFISYTPRADDHYEWGLRKKGHTYDNTAWLFRHAYSFCEVDGDKKIEYFGSSSSWCRFYLQGWTKESVVGGGGAASAGAAARLLI